MNQVSVVPVKKVIIEEDRSNQRVDNFLLTQCKGVPKTRLYRAIRKGEVRVNQKRVKPDYRLQLGDEVRIPPIRVAEPATAVRAPARMLQAIEASILVETGSYLIIDKPSGIPVHGGTGIKTGLIEAVRELRAPSKFMELAHRIDRETSGCLVIAKKRSFLLQFHELQLHKKVSKRYLVLVKGMWPKNAHTVTAPLQKNQLASGERMVCVNDAGKPAETRFRLVKQYRMAALLEATLVTGRTHQIRVHAAHVGHPVAADEKYGDRNFNQAVKKLGLRRLFLHSASIYCRLAEDEFLGICAPMSTDVAQFLTKLGQPIEWNAGHKGS